jgi:hypothetical protein
MKTLVIKDLAAAQVSVRTADGTVRALSHEEMKLVNGGRAIAVLVDGRTPGVMDDFALEMGIFKGDIGVTYK